MKKIPKLTQKKIITSTDNEILSLLVAEKSHEIINLESPAAIRLQFLQGKIQEEIAKERYENKEVDTDEEEKYFDCNTEVVGARVLTVKTNYTNYLITLDNGKTVLMEPALTTKGINVTIHCPLIGG